MEIFGVIILAIIILDWFWGENKKVHSSESYKDNGQVSHEKKAQHNFVNGVCKRCGCTEKGIDYFGWGCNLSDTGSVKNKTVAHSKGRKESVPMNQRNSTDEAHRLKVYTGYDGYLKSKAIKNKEEEVSSLNPESKNVTNPGRGNQLFGNNNQIQESWNIIRDKKLQFRSRYSKNEYPYKIAINIVYSALTYEYLLTEVLDYFKGVQVNSEEEGARVIKSNREKAIIQAHPRVEQVLKTGSIVGPVDLSVIRANVRPAMNGDNEKVESLEYGFSVLRFSSSIIENWLYWGLSGDSLSDASHKVLGGFFPSEATFLEAYRKGEVPIAVFSLAFQSATHQINSVYQPLPALF